MKKLVLLAAAVVLVVPTIASANDYKGKNEDAPQTYTYKKVDNSPNANGEYRIEMQSENDFRGTPGVRTYPIADGQKIEIRGQTAYKIDANGRREFAPNGSYATSHDQTIVVEDGLLDRIETAPKAVLFGMNDTGRHNGRHTY